MPSNHLILCHPLLVLPSIFPNNREHLRFWLKYRFWFSRSGVWLKVGTSEKLPRDAATADASTFQVAWPQITFPAGCNLLWSSTFSHSSNLPVDSLSQESKNIYRKRFSITNLLLQKKKKEILLMSINRRMAKLWFLYIRQCYLFLKTIYPVTQKFPF